jgi:imidazolonepropionase-like amidohydrolase
VLQSSDPTTITQNVTAADALFDVLRGLAADGRTVLIVTHKLREVMAVSDNVTGAVAVRDGVIVEVGPAGVIAARYEAAEVLDATGCLVLPGLINAQHRVSPPAVPY